MLHMNWLRFIGVALVLLFIGVLLLLHVRPLGVQSVAAESKGSYLGFDRNIYPGDSSLPILRKSFAFTSYWLSPPPGEKANTWKGKRALLLSHGYGFLILYRGRESRELRNEAAARRMGFQDAKKAAVCPPTTTRISPFGPRKSPAPAIIRAFIAPACPCRKARASPSPPPTTFTATPRHATSASGPTTISARLRRAALSRKTCHRLLQAASATPPSGNSRSRRAAKNSPCIALRSTHPTATVMLRMTRRTSGSLT